MYVKKLRPRDIFKQNYKLYAETKYPVIDIDLPAIIWCRNME